MNILCFSVGDIVFVDDPDGEDAPDTKVLSLSASEVSFFLVPFGVGGFDTEYIKSSLSSSCTEHESPLLMEQAAESVAVESDRSVLQKETKTFLCMYTQLIYNQGLPTGTL